MTERGDIDGDGLAFDLVDVFTDQPFAGNQLAVVYGSAGLPTTTLQMLAAEFGFSETVFPTVGGAGVDYAVRIFTPSVELPFAGHPSLGAAWVLAAAGLVPTGALKQGCAAGVVGITVEPPSGPGRAPGEVTLTGRPPSVGPVLPAGPLLAAVNLSDGDLAGPPPRLAGAGLEFGYLLVHADAVTRARPVLDLLGGLPGGGLQVVAVEGGGRALSAHARVFAGDIGVAEDPATGSAALGLGAYLVASGVLPGEGESQVAISQGAELGRPSRLSVQVLATGGVATWMSVTGSVVPVATGRIAVPAVPSTGEAAGESSA